MSKPFLAKPKCKYCGKPDSTNHYCEEQKKEYKKVLEGLGDLPF